MAFLVVATLAAVTALFILEATLYLREQATRHRCAAEVEWLEAGSSCF